MNESTRKMLMAIKEHVDMMLENYRNKAFLKETANNLAKLAQNVSISLDEEQEQ